MANNRTELPGRFEDRGRHFYPEFPEILVLCKELASTIHDDCKKTGEKFDRIVAVPRGGLYVAMALSQAFRMEAPEVLSVSLTSYSGHSAESKGAFRVGQWPTDEEVEGKRLLVPDDVFDTGETQTEIQDRFYAQGALKVVGATLYGKDGNSDSVAVRPKYCMRRVPGTTWIHFPWEPLEGLLDGPSVYSGVGYASLKSTVSVEPQPAL